MCFSYALARPNETKLNEHFDCYEPDWKQLTESLLGWLSDDDVKQWAESEGYDIFDDYEEE